MGKRCSCGCLNDDNGIYCKCCGKALQEMTLENKVWEQNARTRVYKGITSDVSILEWLVVLFLGLIPIVQLFVIIFMSFDKRDTFKNYALTKLIILGVLLMIGLILRGCSIA